MLIALGKETSIHQPLNLLIRNLLATNLRVIFIAYTGSPLCMDGAKIVEFSFKLK